jgi:hypothetical protein
MTSTTASSDPGLFSLPRELIIRITRYLSTNDFGSFRRSCSVIEQWTFEDFARAFFTVKQFMLTQPSLQALIDISQHEALGTQLKKLIIGTNAIPIMVREDDVDDDQAQTDQQKSYHMQEYRDQSYLTGTGGDIAMLAEAFRNLKNCSEVEIRDYNSKTRFRDGENACWTSYGATTFAIQAGVETILTEDSYRYAQVRLVFQFCVLLDLFTADEHSVPIVIMYVSWRAKATNVCGFLLCRIQMRWLMLGYAAGCLG